MSNPVSAAVHQCRLFFIALQFFTRLPIPRWVGFEPAWLQHASRYFPLVGVVVAARLQPAILDYCVFSHCSDENGHRQLLANLGARPLLHLDLRLGEGTGSALALPLLHAAVNFMREMATFASAQVSEKSTPD